MLRRALLVIVYASLGLAGWFLAGLAFTSLDAPEVLLWVLALLALCGCWRLEGLLSASKR
ncbi:MAG: hypothetical protein ACE5F1_19150 [Planctomycetota bacterium]